MTPIAWLALLGLWALFVGPYRSYRLDYFRQSLFAIRDDLFDMAAAGELSFDSDAYRMLRRSINGTIRYGHHCGFINFLVGWLSGTYGEQHRAVVRSYNSQLNRAMSQLRPDVRNRLNDMRKKIRRLVIEQVLRTSMTMSIVFVLLSTIHVARSAALATIDRIASRGVVKFSLDSIDCMST